MDKYVGKIAWCDNQNLRIKDKSGSILKGGHYVFVRKKNKNKTYSVSTFTSLEDKNGSINNNQMIQVRKGNIYQFPANDCNFSRWTGLNKNSIVVKHDSLTLSKSKKIKRKHYYMFNKHKK